MPNPQVPVFPPRPAEDLDLMVATNRALSKLTYPIDGVQTQFTVIDGTKFEVPCLVQIDTEIIRVGAKSGNVLQQCTRGFSLTAPASHGQNADVKGYVLSYHHNQVAAEIKAIEAGLGANFGNVVMQDDQAGGEISGVFTNMHLKALAGLTAGTYGGFNKSIILTVDTTGRITSIANAPGNINYPIIYKAAIVQDNNAVMGFSFASTDAPLARAYGVGTDDGVVTNGSAYAVAVFTPGNAYWVQDHFYLPDDWKQDTISLDIYWRMKPGAGTGDTGNVTWSLQVGSIGPGDGPDLVFNSARSVTTTVPATIGQAVKSRITPVYMAGIQAGDELFFKLSRSATDTCVAEAELISIKFNINRDFALVQ